MGLASIISGALGGVTWSLTNLDKDDTVQGIVLARGLLPVEVLKHVDVHHQSLACASCAPQSDLVEVLRFKL